MKQSTIENHTHDSPDHNSTHLQAWSLGWGISRWSIWNVLLLFRPPQLKAVAIIPKTQELVDPDDNFEPAMFRPNGLFFQTPLNHYLRLRHAGGKEDFFLNVGMLLNEFMISRKAGYRALKELLDHAKKELAKIDSTEAGTSLVQEEGSGDGGRDTSLPGGVDN